MENTQKTLFIVRVEDLDSAYHDDTQFHLSIDSAMDYAKWLLQYTTNSRVFIDSVFILSHTVVEKGGLSE